MKGTQHEDNRTHRRDELGIYYSILPTDVTETSITKTDTVKICGYGIGSMFTNPRLIRATVARDRTIVDLLTFFKTPFPLEVFASLEDARMWVSEKKLITFA